MANRSIRTKVQGYVTRDGAGVKLVRVLGRNTATIFDPILLLDSFDSEHPEDYVAGFPLHPHRGIETISYVYCGRMTHRDSLGHEDTIGDGEVQWMTAGSGIKHEETLPASPRLLGVQLWLNLSSKDKMVPPHYVAIKTENIKEIPIKDGMLRLLAGNFDGISGYRGQYLPLDYYDLHLEPEAALVIPTDTKRSVMVFTLLGPAIIAGERVEEKTAVKLTEGDRVEIAAADEKAQVLFISSEKLSEPIAWGGPIVMNTKDELERAFSDLRRGTFLQSEIEY